MKSMLIGIRHAVLAAASILLVTVNSQARVSDSTDWVTWTFKPNFDGVTGGGKISNVDSGFTKGTFELTTSRSGDSNPKPRAEWKSPDVPKGKKSQFQGQLKVVSMGGNKISVAQCFLRDNDGPVSQLAIRWGNRSSSNPLQFYQVQDSGQSTLLSFKLNQTVYINTIIDTKNGDCKVYLNGTAAVKSDAKPVDVDNNGLGSREFYHKLGAYATGSGEGPVKVEWSGIQFWLSK
jgi:hypothetical protein